MKKFTALLAVCGLALAAMFAAPLSVEAHGFNGNFQSNSAGFSGCSNYSNFGVFAVPYVQRQFVIVPSYQPPVIVATPAIAAPPVVVETAPLPPSIVEEVEVVTPTYSNFGVSSYYNLSNVQGYNAGHSGHGFHHGHH